MKRQRRLSPGNRQPVSHKLVFGAAFIGFVLYTLYVLFFPIFGFLIAIREDNTVYTMDQINKVLFSWPDSVNFGNFIGAFGELGAISGDGSFLTVLWNSIWRATISAAFSVMSSAMVCYVVVFYRNRFTKLLYTLGLFVSIIPLYGTSGSMYRLMEQLNLINNPMILIVDISLFGGYFFYMYALYKGLSWQYAEAAFIDGANHFQTFFRVMFPMALPGVAALYVMQFISCWNNYESTILYMRDYPTLAYALYAYESIAKYRANTPAYMAGVLVSLIPVLTLFFIFQNSIMEKVHLGGLKG